MIYNSKDNYKIYYETYGDEKTEAVFMVHGFGADTEMYKYQIKEFVEKGYFIILMDVRSHGKSDEVKSFDYNDVIKDMVGIIDTLKIQRVNFIGVSMGGNIVQLFAIEHTDRVKCLIIGDSFCRIKTFKEKITAFANLKALKLKPSAKMEAKYVEAYSKLGSAEFGQYIFDKTKGKDREVLVGIRKVINRFNVEDSLSKVICPTLVMTGDAFGEWFVNVGRNISKLIVGSEFEVIEGGGDPSNFIKPESFNKKALEFLGKHK